MKRRLLLISIVFALIFAFSLGSVSVYANEVETYTFGDESATSVFTLVDENNYSCTTVNSETGDTIELSGSYNKQDNRIIFYLAGEVLLEAEVGENNTLTMADSEAPEEPILPDTELDELKGIEAYTSQVVEWIIAGVLGLLGTTTLAIAFRKHLKSLTKSVLTALGLLKTNKDTAEEDIKNIKKEAENTLASLKNVKEEMTNLNQKEFNELKAMFKLLCQAFMYIADGTKELVINGTAECVGCLLKDTEKEVIDNASEEIQ